MAGELLLDWPSRSELIARGDHPEANNRVVAYPAVNPVFLALARVLVLVVYLLECITEESLLGRPTSEMILDLMLSCFHLKGTGSPNIDHCSAKNVSFQLPDLSNVHHYSSKRNRSEKCLSKDKRYYLSFKVGIGWVRKQNSFRVCKDFTPFPIQWCRHDSLPAVRYRHEVKPTHINNWLRFGSQRRKSVVGREGEKRIEGEGDLLFSIELVRDPSLTHFKSWPPFGVVKYGV